MKKKILIMSLLQIPTGHHHVAKSIQENLAKESNTFIFEHVDILSQRFGYFEKIISAFYLLWIGTSPSSYRWIYTIFAKGNRPSRMLHLYEWLFLKEMCKIVIQHNPTMIICTHALPSYLLSKLKGRIAWDGIVINVYTDFFIHNVWGKTAIDYHFVPTIDLKDTLVREGICARKIFTTGIPIHPALQQDRKYDQKALPTVLIGGGNFGVGNITAFLRRLQPSGKVMYKVLCGKNKRMLRKIERRANPFLEAISYVESKEEMNRLYDEADLIITKPGGATVAECLQKKLPIIVYDALPGQEEENIRYLKWQGLIFYWRNWKRYGSLERKISAIMAKGDGFRKRAERYQQKLDGEALVRLVMELCGETGGDTELNQ